MVIKLSSIPARLEMIVRTRPGGGNLDRLAGSRPAHLVTSQLISSDLRVIARVPAGGMWSGPGQKLI